MTPQMGDILLTRSDCWSSRLIRRFGYERGEEALVSHAGIFISETLVIEALFRGVKTSLFPDDFKDSEWVVYSPKELNDIKRKMLRAKALTFSAKRYGFLKIIGQALDYLIGRPFFMVHVFTADKFPICSYVVAESYRLLGWTFGVNSKATTPDDILDYTVRHPQKYQLVDGSEALLEDINRVYRG